MSDPTFAQQFGLAVQADILRQAATDQQRREARLAARPPRRDGSPLWPVAVGRRLAGLDRGPAPQGERRRPVPAGSTAPCPSWSHPTTLMDDC